MQPQDSKARHRQALPSAHKLTIHVLALIMFETGYTLCMLFGVCYYHCTGWAWLMYVLGGFAFIEDANIEVLLYKEGVLQYSYTSLTAQIYQCM